MNSFQTRRSTLIIAAIYLVLAVAAIVFSEPALDTLVGVSSSLARLGAFRALLLVTLAFPLALFLVTRPLQGPIAITTPRRRPAWLSPVSAVIVLAVALIGTGLVTYRLGELSVTRAVNGQLEAITKLKAQLLVHWLDERDDDLKLSVGSPQFIELLERWRAAGMRDDLDRQRLLDTLWRLSKTSHYLEVSLRSADNGALLSASPCHQVTSAAIEPKSTCHGPSIARSSRLLPTR